MLSSDCYYFSSSIYFWIYSHFCQIFWR